MKRFILATTIAFTAIIVPASTAFAQPAPTPAELDAAKKAYQDGKSLHDAGKLPEAIEKFKESYRLSKKPTLLYNIGVTMEEAGMEDLALYYFRKFVSDAPKEDPKQAEVADKVKALEKKFNPNGGNTTVTPPTNPPVEVKPDPGDHKTGPIKPAGTYSDKDFQHQIVEDAPPGKPLDVSAFVPEDSGWTVTLYFRGAGASEFTSKPMKWHYKQLIARIPGSKISGSSIQYYVEAKDQAGKEVARAGKSTSPNLVNLDATAQAHFFPDFTDNSAGTTGAGTGEKRHGDEEDPLHKGGEKAIEQPIETPIAPIDGSGGPTDVGSTKFKYLKWGTTAGAATFLGLSVVFYLAAGSQGSNLEADSKSCGNPPCRAFDATDQAFQDAGHSRQTWSRVAFGAGAVTAVVAAYFWYRELSAKKHGESPTVAGRAERPATGLDSLILAPAFGDGFTGAAAAARF